VPLMHVVFVLCKRKERLLLKELDGRRMLLIIIQRMVKTMLKKMIKQRKQMRKLLKQQKRCVSCSAYHLLACKLNTMAVLS